MKSPHRSGLEIVLGTIMLVASMCGAGAQDKSKGGAEPVWPTRGWQTSTPEEQGMDSADLARLVTYGTSRSFDSLLIARHALQSGEKSVRIVRKDERGAARDRDGEAVGLVLLVRPGEDMEVAGL